jgi:pimeloyl-ACP methyl ester carboxylesterase
VAVPTLLLYGDEHQRSPRPVAESLASCRPTCQLVFVSGVGHDVNVEAPEVFDNEVRAFLHRV